MAGPLLGLVILDLSRILAGPSATQLLADYGADVLKVEHPKGGDDTRKWGPPHFKDADGRETGESACYLSTNRGKRSLAIDFSRAEGQNLVRRMATGADVVVENFKVDVLPRALVRGEGTGAGHYLPLHRHASDQEGRVFPSDGPDRRDHPGSALWQRA